MFKINPYRPGVGLKPMYIAGRDEDIESVEQIFEALTMNVPVQSIIYSGLRGVGKTVLINKLEEIANEKEIFCRHIEVEERNDFISQLAECSQAFLRTVSAKEKFKHLIKKPLDAIKSLVVSFNPKKFKVEYTEEAIEKIADITKGYPFFIQQLCKIVYQNTEEDLIEISDVENCIDEFLKTLDEGFFRTRYERCAESDKKFVFAMVKCGELPCTISNVAHNLGKEVYSISTTRAQLISKGIIYPVRYKELDFTVPEFSGYIQRLDEYKKWNNQ